MRALKKSLSYAPTTQRFAVAIISVMLLVAGFSGHAQAQDEPSTRKNPTAFTTNSVEGEYNGAATVHYYRFIAGKGEVTTSLTATTQRYSVNVEVELLDENFVRFDRLGVTANETGRTEKNVHRFARRQPVILKVSLPADTDIKHLKYEIELAGPVEFGDAGAGSGTTAAAGERLCLPQTGTLILQTEDGPYEIDLKQVKTAIVKP